LQPKCDTALTLSLLAVGQHLEGCILEIENTTEIKGNDARLRFLNQESYFLRDVFSIGKENPALQSQQ
jgi:hypothetical protein